MTPAQFTNNQTWLANSIERTGRMAEEAEKKAVQYKKADKRANKKVRIDKGPNNTAKLQQALFDIGAFGNISHKKAVDGIRGRMTNAAIAKAKKLGYTVDENNGTISKKKSILPSTTNNNNTFNIDALSQEEKQAFANYLMETSKNGVINKVSNVANGALGLFGNMTGLMSRLPLNKNTKKLSLALDIVDNTNKRVRDDMIQHNLTTENGRYKWSKVGVKDVDNHDQSFIEKITKYPGTYILGLHQVFTTPSRDKIISDTYNFNEGSNRRYLDKLVNGDVDTYLFIRTVVPIIGKNKDIPISSVITNDEIEQWYNEFKKSRT